MRTKVPMKAETIFSICSISKLFTSIAVMQLWEQGKLGLDDSLQAMLPDYSIKQRYTETVPITVRSMLTHSSGLIRDADSSWNYPGFYFLTPEELKKSMEAAETLYSSSTYLQYSNVAISLLGEIVQRRSGKNYNDYIEEYILKPLQLTNTHPYLPERSWRNELATRYGAINRQGNRTMQPLFRRQVDMMQNLFFHNRKARFMVTVNLVFLVFIGCTHRSNQTNGVAIEWEGNKATGFILPKSLLAGIKKDSLAAWLHGPPASTQ